MTKEKGARSAGTRLVVVPEDGRMLVRVDGVLEEAKRSPRRREEGRQTEAVLRRGSGSSGAQG